MFTKDTKVKVLEEGNGAAHEGPFNLDGILSELGSFGKYQLILLLLLAFRDTFLAMCNFNYVFTAAEVSQRCYVPECERYDDSFNASWSHFALANDTQACHRMSPVWHSPNSTTRPPNISCSAEKFDQQVTTPCQQMIYEDYNSIVAEFDLGCQPWKRTLVGTVHNLGLVVSFVLSGIISDRYGRKVIIVITPLVVGFAGLLKSFSVNYWMLVVLEFLEAALGYGNASLVLSLEAVTQSNRVIYSCISDILSSFGTAFFGLIAWQIPYWRHLMRAIYAPLLVVVFYIFLVDEGVRWLLAHNKKDEAVRVIQKVAKINNITFSEKANKMLTTISEEKIKADQINNARKQDVPRLWTVLRSKTILLRVAVMSACCVCSTFVFNGVIINAVSISGNKYVNFAAMLLAIVPTRFIIAYTLNRFGRKAPICIAYSLCGGFFVASAFVPKNIWWLSILFYLAGKMCSAYGNFSLVVFTMELFPTTSRNFLTNIAQTVGRLGSVVAPQAPLLEQYMIGLPSIVFGVAALGPALLVLLLPDTSCCALPDDVSDAERIEQAADTPTNQTPPSQMKHPVQLIIPKVDCEYI